MFCYKRYFETVELVNIAVDEKQQSKGIGKRLVYHAIENARLLGAKTIEVGTGNSSVGQLALYQKSGFRITGIDKDFLSDIIVKRLLRMGLK